MAEIEKGKRAWVYQDAICEGRAMIVKVHKREDWAAYCSVRFDDETETYDRWVFPEDLEETEQ